MKQNPFSIIRECREVVRTIEDDRFAFLIVLKGYLSIKYLKENFSDFKETLSLDSKSLSKKLFYEEYLKKDLIFDKNVNLNDSELRKLYNIIKKSNFSIHPDIFTILFEILPEVKNKNLGQVFTPIHITRYIVKHSNFKLSSLKKHSLKEIRVIDPSMGYGKFIVEFYHVLNKVYKKKEYAKDIHKAIIENNIFGIDKDQFMVNLSVIYLLTLKPKKYYETNKLELNLIQADSLIKNDSLKFQSFDDKTKKILSQKYDYVLGNPPYSKVFSENEKEYYMETYKESIGGHPNLCTLFIHRGIELLKKGGMLGFIVAAPYTTGVYNTNVRKLIIDKTRIKELLLFNDRKKTIRNVLQAFSIVILEKEQDLSDYFIKVTEIKDLSSLRKNHIKFTKIRKNRVIYDSDHNYMFLISADKKIYDIVEKVKKNSKKLIDYCDQISTGQVVNFRVKNQITSTKKAGAYPLIDIKNVYPYHIDVRDDRNCSQWYIPKTDYDDKIKMENNVILVKRMTSPEQKRRVVAGYGDFEKETVFLGNKVNYINLKNADDNTFFILSLLNSNLYDFYFRRFSSNTQVSANELRLMPIKKNGNVEINKIIQLSKKNEQLMEQFTNTKDKNLKTEFDKNQDLINKLIYQMYELNNEEINYIESNGR